MALIVEDGSIVAGAESYISVTDADSYFSARGNTAWAALDATAKEAALRSATDYMGGAYGLRWKGERVSASQALDWPRSGVYANGFLVASSVVPEAVQRACAELGVRASAGALQGDVGAQVKQEVVGPISVTYADGARQDTAYKAVDALLSAYLGVGSGQFSVVRA